MKNKNKHIIKFYKYKLDILIELFFWLLIMATLYFSYNIIRFLICRIPNVQDIIGNIISASVSLLIFIAGLFTKLRNKIVHMIKKTKHKLYKFLCQHNIYLFSKGIVNFNVNSYIKTQGQTLAINKALKILQEESQGIISIESIPGKGKTTTALLLMDLIGSDAKLLDIFIRLNNNVIYFDIANNITDFFNYMQKQEQIKNSVIVIDNLHKLSLEKLDKSLDIINNLVSYFKETHRCFLLILMYQNHKYNRKISKYIQDFNSSNNINEYIILDDNNAHFIEDYSTVRKYHSQYPYANKLKDGLFEDHVKRILQHNFNSYFCNFLYKLVICDENINIISDKDRDLLQMLSEILLISSYFGYVNKKTLIFLWKHYSNNYLKGIYLIKMMERSKFLISFPFAHNAFLFNEILSLEYKKHLIKLPKFVRLYQKNAIIMYQYQQASPNRWLYLISADVKFYKNINTKKEEALFNNSLLHLNINYILEILENELSLFPQKMHYFNKKIGLLYIRNGEWKKARSILLPYIDKVSDFNEAHELFLKIIEADHGIDDTENLKTLELIKKHSTDDYIIYKANYWKTHIHMEQGVFNLYNWEILYQEWLLLEKQGYKDDVIHYRILSDYARVYFLTGISDYKRIAFVFKKLDEEKNKSPKLWAEYSLITRAHYLHYEIIYKLGIWGWLEDSYDDNTYITSLLDSERPLEECVTEGINSYNIAINKYGELGDKKIHTATARLNDLKLCYTNCNYINIINHFKQFRQYAQNNNILVFEGYCETLCGKAFILYGDNELLKGNIHKATTLFNQAEKELDNACIHYNNYGNNYGCLRGKLLLLLLSVVQNPPKINSTKKIINKIDLLVDQYNTKDKYIREHQVLQYFKQNINQVNTARTILRFYPIILQ